ncbi:MAG: diaminopimelate epimerase, partial [Candidatus Marinimicrobia bacterium]|nr:diaminopimelate epimerase [Candidatus Neomarinimicrobiota bacterium]
NGNDFILFDAANAPAVIRDESFIQRVCNRKTGIGADGVLILSTDTTSAADFLLDYHNADGSWETFCGNGSRCAVQYFLRGKGGSNATVRTGAGVHRARVIEAGLVELQILPPRLVSEVVEVEGFAGQHVDSGAPHFAAEVSPLQQEMIAAAGPAIRHAGQFQPRGINVNFYERIDESTLKVMTYEKGVEAVVDSCASGSVAASYQAAMTGKMKSPIRVINPGGDLTVTFDDQWHEVTVTGPAVIVFQAQLPDDF